MPMRNAISAEALHRFTIPVFIRTLEIAKRILVKAERHAQRHGIEPATLLSARLYPDMFSLLQQVQYLCFIPVDFAKNFSTAAAPRVGYDETTFADLKASMKQTIRYLRTVKPEHFKAQEGRLLPLFFDPSRGLPTDAHAARMTLPDFFFHATVAYAILRHSGVPLGKADFLGPLKAAPLKRKNKPR
jgi:hypothetical protein